MHPDHALGGRAAGSTWLHDDVFGMLGGTAPRCASTTCWPTTRGSWTTDWTYVRFHGPERSTSRTSARTTGRRLWRGGRPNGAGGSTRADVYAYFNNDWDGNAVDDARWLRSRLS